MRSYYTLFIFSEFYYLLSFLRLHHFWRGLHKKKKHNESTFKPKSIYSTTLLSRWTINEKLTHVRNESFVFLFLGARRYFVTLIIKTIYKHSHCIPKMSTGFHHVLESLCFSLYVFTLCKKHNSLFCWSLITVWRFPRVYISYEH